MFIYNIYGIPFLREKLTSSALIAPAVRQPIYFRPEAYYADSVSAINSEKTPPSEHCETRGRFSKNVTGGRPHANEDEKACSSVLLLYMTAARSDVTRENGVTAKLDCIPVSCQHFHCRFFKRYPAKSIILSRRHKS